MKPELLELLPDAQRERYDTAVGIVQGRAFTDIQLRVNDYLADLDALAWALFHRNAWNAKANEHASRTVWLEAEVERLRAMLNKKGTLRR